MTGRGRPAWFETAFGEHYVEVYAHRDASEARRCVALLPRLAPLGEGPVLDLGCGQGRHLASLSEQGVEAVGADLSWPLLRRARRDRPRQPLLRADMRAIPLRDASTSAVLSLFTAFGYFGPAAAHAPVVAEIARVLRPGGHWFLDFLNSERVPREVAGATSERRRELESLRVSESRTLADHPPRVVKTVRVEPRPGREDAAAALGVEGEGLAYAEEVTLFSLAELDDLARGAGLERVAAAGDYDGGALDPAVSERWLLVYRRTDTGREGP